MNFRILILKNDNIFYFIKNQKKMEKINYIFNKLKKFVFLKFSIDKTNLNSDSNNDNNISNLYNESAKFFGTYHKD